MNRKVLFLDFDGVLHPSEVYRDSGGRIYLAKEFQDDGHFLFEHAHFLIQILEKVEAVRPVEIVLSTSWVEVLGGLEPAKAFLPAELQQRVRGAVWDSRFTTQNRLQQIKRYVNANGLKPHEWVAVDDNLDSWAVRNKYRQNLVLTHQFIGLGSATIQRELISKLMA